MELAFLEPLLQQPGPWASVYLDTSRRTEDAVQRRALIDRDAVHRLAGLGADERTCAAVRDHLAGLRAAGSPPGRAVFAADGAVVLDVPLSSSPPQVDAQWSVLPHTAPLLGLLDEGAESCLLATVDRTGADLELRGLRGVSSLGQVEGVVLQGRGHRAPPADRYEWHYRHRQEDAWDRTADRIAAELARVLPESGAALLVLTGDVRERHSVHRRLPRQLLPHVVEVEGGSRAGGTDPAELDRRIAAAWEEQRQHHLSAALEEFRAGLGRPGTSGAAEHGGPVGAPAAGSRTPVAPSAAAQGVPEVVDAARQRQIATLLMQRDGSDAHREVWVGPAPEHVAVRAAEVRGMGVPRPEPAPAADALLRCAVAAGAEVLVIPEGAAGPAGGLGAVLRRARPES